MYAAFLVNFAPISIHVGRNQFGRDWRPWPHFMPVCFMIATISLSENFNNTRLKAQPQIEVNGTQTIKQNKHSRRFSVPGFTPIERQLVN